MKSGVVTGLLAGALLASAGLNVRYALETRPTREPTGHACSMMSAGRACVLSERLGLTEAQRERITGCCGGMCAARNAQEERLRSLVDELAQLLNAETLDRERVLSLSNEIADLQAEAWKNRIHCVLRVREVLTPEQLQRLVAVTAGP